MNIRALRIILFSLFVVSSAHAQTILLPDQWLFKTGDNQSFKSPRLNDSAWTSVNVPSYWEREGFDSYDGFAWYRVHFAVEPRLLKQKLNLLLGRVDDVDQVFLNGRLIGSAGKFPPNAETAYMQLRAYKIPVNLLKASNVLAVRTFDMMGPGGIVAGPIGIYNEKDYQDEVNPKPIAQKSFNHLVTSNGLIAALFNAKRGSIETVRPHIFQAYDSAQYVRPFLARIAPTLNDLPSAVSYKQNSHVIAATYRNVEVNYFAPFTTDEKVFYAVVSGPEDSVRHCSFTFQRLGVNVLVDSVFFKRSDGSAQKYFLFGFTDSLHRDSSTVFRAAERLRLNDGALLQAELDFMRQLVARSRIPHGITASERALFEQSIAVLKMAQVSKSEVLPLAQGQILASLPPGEWNIAWVRDGMYAILALTRLGLFEEARSALDFSMKAPSGHYVRFVHKDSVDHGVGVPYRISVCRYFGNGKEESDINDAGPNIELDGFGLFLIAFSDYVQRSGDNDFFGRTFQKISAEVADVILHCIDTNNLIRKDSGPWERHLPGKQFAYTSITCAAGLRDYAQLCAKQKVGDSTKYRLGYEKLLDGIRKNLIVDDALIKGNEPARDSSEYDYFDGGTFEAFGFGLFQDESFFYSHLNAYESALRVPGERRGFSRINKGDWYETAEWVFLDLRAASVLHTFGTQKKARELLDWITDQGALNFNLLPELLNEKTARYSGAIPMVGYGAGVYILSLFDMY